MMSDIQRQPDAEEWRSSAGSTPKGSEPIGAPTAAPIDKRCPKASGEHARTKLRIVAIVQVRGAQTVDRDEQRFAAKCADGTALMTGRTAAAGVRSAVSSPAVAPKLLLRAAGDEERAPDSGRSKGEKRGSVISHWRGCRIALL